jgi:hypothetical protein
MSVNDSVDVRPGKENVAVKKAKRRRWEGTIHPLSGHIDRSQLLRPELSQISARADDEMILPRQTMANVLQVLDHPKASQNVASNRHKLLYTLYRIRGRLGRRLRPGSRVEGGIKTPEVIHAGSLAGDAARLLRANRLEIPY